MQDRKKLTDFKVLSFDVYSTLVDQNGGFFAALQPLLSRLPSSSPIRHDRSLAVSAFSKFEGDLERSDPSLPHDLLLERAYLSFASSLGLDTSLPSWDSEAKAFGACVPSWPAFPDTVAALQFLSSRYKLVPLSNIDNASIAATCAGPLKGVRFDAVYTAQDIGSYKPDFRNFEYLLENVEREFGVGKDEVLHVANGLRYDQVPAKELGIESVWIGRGREVGVDEERDTLKAEGKVGMRWTFGTMGELADAVKKELGE